MTEQQETAVTVWRLYTQDFPNLPELVSRYVDGATLTLSTGLWEGKREMARVIEIIGPANLAAKIRFLAEDIKTLNRQAGVLITVSRQRSFTV